MSFSWWRSRYHTVYVAAEMPINFITVPVIRGDLLSAISATCTVEPEEVVDVGAQVVAESRISASTPTTGKRKNELITAAVIHEDTELADIDDAVYKAQVDQAKAADNATHKPIWNK